VTANPDTKIDQSKYRRLLSRALPGVIETEAENERLLAEIEKLLDKGEDNLTPEEDKLLALMVRLVEDYELAHYPIKDAAPHEVLQELMQARSLRQRDLVMIFGSSGYTSDVVNGKRGISKEQAKRLAEFFHVSPEAFI
jgi:HTH-type transcriptional regulator / antitoxin HigA